MNNNGKYVMGEDRRDTLQRLLLNEGSLAKEGRCMTNTPDEVAFAAIQQWYDRDPELWVLEKQKMAKMWPGFEFVKLADGRYSWTGILAPEYKGRIEWQVHAIYDNDHPRQVMGSSVRVYLIDPSIEDLLEGYSTSEIGHLLRDEKGNLYLCTAEADSVKSGKGEVTSAAASIMMAYRWILAFEMVLAGDLSIKQFSTHGVI